MVGYAQSESNFIDTMQGIDSIKNFNKQMAFESLNKTVYSVFQENVFQLGKINIRLSFVSGLISLFLIIASIGIGSYLVLSDYLKLGELMAVISLVASISPAIVNLSLIAIPLNEAKVAFNRMFEFVGISTEKTEGIIFSETPVSIAMENISFRFPGRKRILENISLAVNRNEIIFIIGESGCGKSTLLKSLNRMNDLVEGCKITGKVELDGEDIYGDMDVNVLRKRVGMVFQKPNPFPMSIYDNVAYGPRTHGIRSKAKLDEIVEKSLRDAAIWDEVKDRLKKSALGMSGGQQQRLCIARALAVEPEVLLMDEPTSALDPISTSKIEELAMELKGKYTIVIVTHNMQQATRISDKTAFFLLGEVVEFSDTDTLFSMPKDKRTEDYITGRFG